MKIKNLLVRVVKLLCASFILTGCESEHVDVYIKNNSSQMIVFRGQSTNFPNYDGIVNYAVDSVTIKSGEKALVLKYTDEYAFERNDMRWLMEGVYSKGIRIEFADGETYDYQPVSYETDFASPYNYKSFFYHEKDHDFEATYNVLY